jgi:alkylation response protein AidB-like acyl-CoA dehydrogenase
MGMTVPREYGGGGFSHTSYCRVLEHVSQWCASTAVLIGAHQSIGLKALVLMGTEEQKREFLPDLAVGKKLAAFCLSEPEVGSDAANVQTLAAPSPDGTHWILNGEKKYATNAALASVMTVMARTPITENGKTRDKVTAFIVTPDLPGFEVVSPNRSKCGIRGSWQATLRFHNMAVPNDRILGQLGKGLKVALGVLNYGRCTLSAGCVGGAKRATELSVQRVKVRKQFGRPIAEFHLVKDKIARMAEMTFAMESLTYLCAGLVDRHAEDIMLETAISKLFCSEGLWQIADDTLQLWGGEGYMREHGIERILRDARINRIVEGTTEVMTAFIALAGMKSVGEDLEQVLRASKHPVNNFGRLARFAREQWRDVLIGPHVHDLHPQLADEGHQLARLTTRLARDVFHLLRTHREKILDMELLQQRVSLSVVDLYAMAAVLSRLQSQLVSAGGNGHQPESLQRDLIVGKGFCHRAAGNVSRRLKSLFRNNDEETLAIADAVLGQ